MLKHTPKRVYLCIRRKLQKKRVVHQHSQATKKLKAKKRKKEEARKKYIPFVSLGTAASSGGLECGGRIGSAFAPASIHIFASSRI
jgi:hypothetical protein